MQTDSQDRAFQAGLTPHLVGAHLIDEEHSHRFARLEHMHEHELELFYVRSGEGQYAVDGVSYHISQGDVVICNARVLHGEDPGKQRRMHSYSIALTDVQLEGLPDNHLIERESDPVIHCGALSEQIGEMMRLIYLLHSSRQGHIEQVCHHSALAVLYLIYGLLCSRDRARARQSVSAAGLLARRIKRYLDEHYNEPLTLKSIGSALHVSEYYAAHVFRTEMGLPPMQYVMKRRMGEAQTLLMDTRMPVADISEQLGYGNPWNFSTAFSRCVGMPPSEYRRTFHRMTGVREDEGENA